MFGNVKKKKGYYSALLSAALGECSACKETAAVEYSWLQRFATDT